MHLSDVLLQLLFLLQDLLVLLHLVSFRVPQLANLLVHLLILILSFLYLLQCLHVDTMDVDDTVLGLKAVLLKQINHILHLLAVNLELLLRLGDVLMHHELVIADAAYGPAQTRLLSLRIDGCQRVRLCPLETFLIE